MDIIFNIMVFLDIGDIIKCKSINKLFHDGCIQQQLWKKLLSNDYPNTEIYMTSHYETYKYYHKSMDTLCKEFNINPMKTTLYNSPGLILAGMNKYNIPSEIGLLHNLKSLNLNYSSIQVVPTQIGQLKKLIRLDLQCNDIKELPTEIGQLYKLKIMSLDNNYLYYLPSELNNLTNLDEIYLRHNCFRNKQIIHNEFPNIKKIII
jgi:hypothetical protein